ncbi:hypothetical protein [Anatilimnocola floriformis]|uniref:hypothetical protein n=1 Tax=Anatilimnocola floriformis TaxID=2948575 RepID=UPI0020C2740A|nr:hypothetical protein [Anatilimnocola floriformis]
MTTRIGSQITAGELTNKRRNSVCGWIDFAVDYGVRLELTGNLSGELAGKHLRFASPAPSSDADCPRKVVDDLANFQNGVTGQIELRTLADGRTSIYLEWFSQDGPIVAEVFSPTIVFDPPDLPPPSLEEWKELQSGDLLGESEPTADDADPYQLFPENLDEQLHAANAEEKGDGEIEESEVENAAAESGQKLPWDEVIPGIDPETKQLYEQMDEVLDGTKDVPFTELFDPPLVLKKSVDIVSEEDAVEELRKLLARLAWHCVAVHMCEHSTARETYRWLVDDLLPEECVHPRLGPTGYTRHYDTGEDCAECDAKFEREWNERKGKE